MRSQFGETSEALFLTQGYVYDTSAQAEARFKGEDPGLSILALRQSDREHVRAAHGGVRRRGSRARDRDRHGRGDAVAAGPGARPAIMSSRPRRCSALAATWSRTSCRATASTSTLVDGPDLDEWRAAMRPNTKTFFLESADQSDARDRRHRGVAKIAHAAGATLVVDNVFATPLLAEARSNSAPTASSIPPPSTSTARAAASAASSWAREKFINDNIHTFIRQTGAVDVAVQRLGDAEGPRDAGGARARADRHGGGGRRCAGGAPEDVDG